MASRATLLTACHQAAPDSPEWRRAVTALGAASRAGFPPPPPGRKTGENPVHLVERVTRSRVFQEDREELRAAAKYGNPAELPGLVDHVLQQAKERKKTMQYLYYPTPCATPAASAPTP